MNPCQLENWQGFLVLGDVSEVANLQDLLLFVVRGIAVYNEHLRKEGQSSEQADKFIYDALFITITNANFDKVAITEKIKEGRNQRAQ